MNLTVHQSIVIHHLKVEVVSNASILQIGCAGTMKSVSQLFNTGGFTGPAPEPGKPFSPEAVYIPSPQVPLASIR
jgi:spore germination protein PB